MELFLCVYYSTNFPPKAMELLNSSNSKPLLLLFSNFLFDFMPSFSVNANLRGQIIKKEMYHADILCLYEDNKSFDLTSAGEKLL